MTDRRGLGLLRAAMPVAATSVAAVSTATLLFGSFLLGLFLGAIFAVVVIVPAWAASKLGLVTSSAGRVAPPGIPLLALILVSECLLAIASSAPWTWFPAGLSALLLWSLAGTIWLVKLGLAALLDGAAVIRARWRRWLVPLLVGLLGFSLAVSSIPLHVRFALSRDAVDAAADQARDGTLAGSDVRLGLYDGRLWSADGGTVSFYLGSGAGGAFLGEEIWGIADLGQDADPAFDACTQWQHLDGPWWLWRQQVYCSY